MELLECPFCGSQVDWCECKACHQIQCKGCGAQIDNTKLGITAETLEECRIEMAAWWNRRAKMQIEKQSAALKLAKDALETCDVGDCSTGHVIDPSFDAVAVDEALVAIDEALKGE